MIDIASKVANVNREAKEDQKDNELRGHSNKPGKPDLKDDAKRGEKGSTEN
jgi:hypothetical protein